MTDLSCLLGSVYVNDNFLGHQLPEVAACDDKFVLLLAEAAECHAGDYSGGLWTEVGLL